MLVLLQKSVAPAIVTTYPLTVALIIRPRVISLSIETRIKNRNICFFAIGVRDSWLEFPLELHRTPIFSEAIGTGASSCRLTDSVLSRVVVIHCRLCWVRVLAIVTHAFAACDLGGCSK